MTCETRKDDSYRRILYLSEYGAVLDGIIPNDELKNIPEIIREASSLKLRDEMETIDGHQTFVLEAQTKYGIYVLWIDPEYGYNPRQISACKDVEEKLNPLEDVVYRTSPDSPMTREEITVNSIRIEKVDDVFVPTAAKLTRYRTFADGQWTRIRVVEKRSNFNFDSDFDSLGAFVMELSSGVKIRNKDIPFLSFVWHDGRIRPTEDGVIATNDSREKDVVRQSPKNTRAEPEARSDSNMKVTATNSDVDGNTGDRKSISFKWLASLVGIALLALVGVRIGIHRQRST